MTYPLLAAVFLAGVLVGFGLDELMTSWHSRTQRKALAMPRITTPRWIVALIAILAAAQVLVGAITLITRAEASDKATCQAAYNQAYAEAVRPRNAAAQDKDLALDEVVEAVSRKDQAAADEAVRNYLSVRAAQIKVQAQNTYPNYPNDYCGDKK